MKMSRKPHILLFNPDQMRADAMGHLGNPAMVTPFIDRWVERDAVSYSSAVCQAPVCTPSRCSFTTGLYPHVFGHRSLHHMLHAERGETNMLRLARENGYFVWWGGKNDVVTADDGPEAYSDVYFQADEAFFERHQSRPRSDMHRGDQSWRGAPGSDGYYSFLRGELERDPRDRYYLDEDWQNVLGAVDFIASAPQDKPLLIYLPILFPHPPYGVESEFYRMTRDVPLPPRRVASETQMGLKSRMLTEIRRAQRLGDWPEARWDDLRRTYLGMVARVDRQFELLIDALKRAGIYDDTAVFLFSDHGDYTGDYGVVEKSQNCFEDPLVRVPLIVKPPADRPAVPGVRSGTLAELVDVAATVFDLAGIDPGYDHFGRSLLPSIADASAGHRQHAFCEGGRRPDEMQVSELESLTQFGPDPTVGLYFPRINVQVHDPAAHGRAVMVRTLTAKYIRRMDGADEFYDLERDPLELDNRVNDPACADAVAALKDTLLGWYLETSDIVPRKTDGAGVGPIRRPKPPDDPTGASNENGRGPASMANIEVIGLNKHYGRYHALKDINLSLGEGEFVVMVGPSGCGKSTLLRTIAGLEDATSGQVFVNGREVTHLAPRERGLAMVFQNYALYPHLTVAENMGFALRLAKRPKAEIDKAVRHAAETLQLTALLDKKPRHLSGGQRQRVAIGRAIVRQPDVFLFDEPLSNLDAALRAQMRVELSALHHSLGTSMIYVTHDQVEAMTMAQRIVLMRDGRIEQVGAPLELYNRPANRFVAGFLGSPKMNFFAATAVARFSTSR